MTTDDQQPAQPAKTRQRGAEGSGEASSDPLSLRSLKVGDEVVVCKPGRPIRRAVAPSASEKKKLVRLLAAYILVEGAPIQVQSSVYDEYMAYLTRLEAKYPAVSFRSDASVQSLAAQARIQASRKVMRGAGATW